MDAGNSSPSSLDSSGMAAAAFVSDGIVYERRKSYGLAIIILVVAVSFANVWCSFRVFEFTRMKTLSMISAVLLHSQK